MKLLWNNFHPSLANQQAKGNYKDVSHFAISNKYILHLVVYANYVSKGLAGNFQRQIVRKFNVNEIPLQVSTQRVFRDQASKICSINQLAISAVISIGL